MAVVGSAEVVVKAVTTGVKKQIKDALKDARADIAKQGELAGTEYGKAFRKSVRKETKKQLTALFRESIGTARTAGRDAGEAFGKAFVTAASDQAKNVGQSFADQLDKGFDKSASKVSKNIKKRLKDLVDYNDVFGKVDPRVLDKAIDVSGIKIDIDKDGKVSKDTADQLDKQLDKFNKQVARSAKKYKVLIEPGFDVRTDYDKLEGIQNQIIERVKQRLGGKDGKKVDLDLPVNLNILNPDFDAQLDYAAGKFREAQEKIREEDEETKKRLRSTPFGRLRAAISSISARLDALRGKMESARKSFVILYSVGAFLATGLTTLVGAIASVGSVIGSLAVAVGQAAGALIILPSLITAVAQAALTLKAAFSGVGEAISSGFKSVADGVKGASGASTAAADRIADAKQRLADTYEDAAYRQAEAEERVREAEVDLADAIYDLEQAQSRLNDAYERGREELEDLAFSAEGAALAEEEAALRLEDAVLELQRVQNLPPDNRARREAELAYQRAELNYRQAKDRNEDLAKEQEKAAEAGVEGTNAVIDAKQDIADAEDNLIDKQKALADAQEDAYRSAVQSARAIRDAKKALADALAAAAAGVAGAQSATDKFIESLRELPLEAQKFVLEVLKFKPVFERLQGSAAAGFFGEVNDSVKELQSLFDALLPIFYTTGVALGEVARKIIELVSSAGFLTKLDEIARTNRNSIYDLGNAFVDLVDGFASVLVAADPLVRRFTDWVRTLAGNFREFANSTEGQERMIAFFDQAGDRAADFGEIIRNLTRVFQNYAETTGPAIDYILDRLKETTDEWARYGAASSGSLAQQQEGALQAAKNTEQLGGLLGDLLRVFQELGRQPAMEETFRILREAVVPFREMVVAGSDAGPAFANLVVSISELFAEFAKTDALTVFFDTLTLITDAITDFLKTDIGQALLTTLAPLLAVTKAISLALLPLTFLLQALGGTIFKYVIDPLKVLYGKLKGPIINALGAFSKSMGAAGGGAGGFFKALFNVIKIASRFTVVIGLVISVVVGFWKAITSNGRLERIINLFKAVGNILSKTVFPAVGGVIKAVGWLFDRFTDLIGLGIGAFIDTILVGLEGIVLGVSKVVNWFTDAKDALFGFFSGGSDAAARQFEERIANMDDVLSSALEGGRIDDAKKRFNELSAELREAGYSTEEIAELMPQYTAALEDAEAEQAAMREEVYRTSAEWNGQADAIDKVLRRLDEIKGGTQSVTEAQDNYAEVQERTNGLIAQAGTALLEQTQAGRDARAAVIEQVDSMWDLLEAQEASLGAGFDLAGEYAKEYERMSGIIQEQTGLSGEALEDYLRTLGLVPPEEVTELKIDKDTAVAQIQAYIFGELDSVPEDIETVAEWDDATALSAIGTFKKFIEDEIPGQTLTDAEFDALAAITDIDELRRAMDKIQTYKKVTVELEEKVKRGETIYNYNLPSSVTSGYRNSAEGGPVIGPGGPKDDKAGLYALSNGEFVLSAAAVSRLGGLGAVNRMHSNLKSGVRGLATGGAPGAGGMTTGEAAIVGELQRMRSEPMAGGSMSVNIGSINSTNPQMAAEEIIRAMRSQAWLMGMGLS